MINVELTRVIIQDNLPIFVVRVDDGREAEIRLTRIPESIEAKTDKGVKTVKVGMAWNLLKTFIR